MGRHELEDQTDIIKSLKAAGGWGRKWASAFQVGCPDLICTLPRVGMFIMEVKQLSGENMVDIYRTRLPVTPKQWHELEAIYKGGGTALIGVVVRNTITRLKHLIVVPWDTEFLHTAPVGIYGTWERGVYKGIVTCVTVAKAALEGKPYGVS